MRGPTAAGQITKLCNASWSQFRALARWTKAPSFHHVSAVEHARRSWLLASFSLRSGTHVPTYAPLRSSRKPRQKPGLTGGQLKDLAKGQTKATMVMSEVSRVMKTRVADP